MRISAFLTGLVLVTLSVSIATAACDGDCDYDGGVTVDEVIRGVSIALGTESIEQCTVIDRNADRQVTVDEIVSALTAALDGCPAAEPRLIVLSREGRIASVDLTAPWTVRASADLGSSVLSARCRAGRCLVVHGSGDAVSVVDANDLTLLDTVRLERGSDPRDAAFVNDHTAVISEYGRAELLVIDLTSGAQATVDLSSLADEDRLPETLRLASCDTRVFAQLLRIDHETEAPAKIGAVLAVIDFASASAPLEGTLTGTIALADRPKFDMPVDCEAGKLYVAEPRPLMREGGGYEQVDLTTLTASDLPIDTGAEVGGFEVAAPEGYWLITHTDIGPGPSSHLNFVGEGPPDTRNTFAIEHVNDLALDEAENLLFYPDACGTLPPRPACEAGVHVFRAHSGERIAAEPIDVGFPPIELAISR